MTQTSITYHSLFGPEPGPDYQSTGQSASLTPSLPLPPVAPVVPRCEAAAGEGCAPFLTFSRSLFLDRMEQAANLSTSQEAITKAAINNYVLRRDEAGRPTVWRLGSMNRKIAYLHNGKIRSIQDTGKLARLATGHGKDIHLLGFETHDFGRTYIGRLMVGDEIDSFVMTDLYLRNDGTVVATDDSGCEMTWNPNNGDTSTEIVQHNQRRETWIDHLDETVTIFMNFRNGTMVKMEGTYEAEFRATYIQIKYAGSSIELEKSGDRVSRTVIDSRGRSQVTNLEGDLIEASRSILQADGIRLFWGESGIIGDGESCHMSDELVAVVTGSDDTVLLGLNHESLRLTEEFAHAS